MIWKLRVGVEGGIRNDIYAAYGFDFENIFGMLG